MGRIVRYVIGGLVILLVILTVTGGVPSVPEITATVQVSTLPNHHPAFDVTSLVYRRVSLIVASSEPKDRVMVLRTSTSQVGARYFLSVVVQYQNQMVIQGGSDVSDGAYLVKASFWPRSEVGNIPYVVTFTVSQGGLYYATLEANVLPA
jgi:hypothetical protein